MYPELYCHFVIVVAWLIMFQNQTFPDVIKGSLAAVLISVFLLIMY